MEKKTRKLVKSGAIAVGAILLAVGALMAWAIHFVFTPEKLTPVVLDIVNRSLNADLKIKSVELTFFSTFPKFGLKVEEGTLVSKALNGGEPTKTDSLLVFDECMLTVNPMDYVMNNKVSVYNLSLHRASIYAYRNKMGKANWEIAITKTPADTLEVEDSFVSQSNFDSEIDINRIELKHVNLVFDDRNTEVYSRIDDANLHLKLSLTKGTSSLGLEFDNKNLLLWQQGELLANHLAISLQTGITVNNRTSVWTLRDTGLSLNGIRLDVSGELKRDTVAKVIDMDLDYGLHAPSMETVLNMIPEAYVKRGQVAAKGEVVVNGKVKGKYGNKQLPAASLNIRINEASAHYAGLPYGIDCFTADFKSYVDLMRRAPSYLNLKILHFKGAHTEILADAKVEDLLGDPLITFHTESAVDLDALVKPSLCRKA